MGDRKPMSDISAALYYVHVAREKSSYTLKRYMSDSYEMQRTVVNNDAQSIKPFFGFW